MSVKSVTADAPGKDTGMITYVCEVCKTETARPHKGPQIESKAS